MSRPLFRDGGLMARKRRKQQSGSNTGLIVGFSIAGGLLFLTVMGLAIYFSLGKSGKSGDDSFGGGFLDLGNSKVSEASYEALTDGMTPAEVEAILGSGRSPTTRDLDETFGESRPESRLSSQQMRESTEANIDRGLVRCWSNGPQRIFVTYTHPPDQEGRLLVKLIRRSEGSYGLMLGTGRPPKPPPSTSPNTAPKTQPKFDPKSPTPNVTADQLVAEYATNRNAASNRYRGRPIRVTGKIDSVLVSMLTFQTTGAKLKAQLGGVATGEISRYKPGDTITVVGVIKAYFPQTGMVLLDNCNLEN
jgi:hypothetical protein